MKKRMCVVFLCFVAVAFSACWGGNDSSAIPSSEDISAREDLVSEIKAFERALGFAPTKNFLFYSDATEAYFRCYYTAKLHLPDSSRGEGMGYTGGNKTGCPLDESELDVFFYPIEAVAGIETPITPSLVKSRLERFTMVVFHEDFHEQVPNLPRRIDEAATTLIGFLAASEFAKEHFGADSNVFHNLTNDITLYLLSSELVNAWHGKLTSLYAQAAAGTINEDEALAEKETLFAQLKERCEHLQPEIKGSVSACVRVYNNAGLGFAMTYQKYYPFMYALFLEKGWNTNLKEAVQVFKQLSNQNPATEEEAIAMLLELANVLPTSASP